MIGSGLRKYAQEKNLVVGHGVAYGLLNGYCATFSEGAGWKKLTLSTCFPQGGARFAFQEQMETLRANIQKGYAVQNLSVAEKRIDIVFTDTVGTMKRIAAFVDWFFPILEQSGAARADVCPECGAPLIGGRWKLIDGVAMYVHEACGQKLRSQMDSCVQTRKESGSYLSGTAGALLGAVGGAVVWALVAMAGYILSLVGLLMGFLADKCYDLFHGKQGNGKLAILILVVILGVLVGNFAAFVAEAMQTFDLTVSEGVELTTTLLEHNEELKSTFVKDCLMGLLFAGIGVFGIFMNTKKAVATPKYIDLD